MEIGSGADAVARVEVRLREVRAKNGGSRALPLRNQESEVVKRS